MRSLLALSVFSFLFSTGASAQGLTFTLSESELAFEALSQAFPDAVIQSKAGEITEISVNSLSCTHKELDYTCRAQNDEGKPLTMTDQTDGTFNQLNNRFAIEKLWFTLINLGVSESVQSDGGGKKSKSIALKSISCYRMKRPRAPKERPVTSCHANELTAAR